MVTLVTTLSPLWRVSITVDMPCNHLQTSIPKFPPQAHASSATTVAVLVFFLSYMLHFSHFFLSFSFLFSNAHTFPPHCSPRLLLRPLFLPYLAGAGAGAGVRVRVRVKVLLGSGFGYRPTRNRCKRAFVTTPPSLTTEGMHNAQASSLATGLSR